MTQTKLRPEQISVSVKEPALLQISAPEEISTDFRNLSALPSGWAWASTSPFTVPNVVDYGPKFLAWRDDRGVAYRNFLYRDLSPASSFQYWDYVAYFNGTMFTANFWHGLRMDDGTDNNYLETGYQRQTTGAPYRWYYYHRTGGGTVTQAEMTQYVQYVSIPFLMLSFAARGPTLFSSWSGRMQLVADFVVQQTLKSSLTWTPSRIGFSQRRTTYAWDTSKVVFDAWKEVTA